MKLSRRIQALGACDEAVAWVDEMSIEEAWKKCDRATWMAWLIGRVCPPAVTKRLIDILQGQSSWSDLPRMAKIRFWRIADTCILSPESLECAVGMSACTWIVETHKKTTIRDDIMNLISVDEIARFVRSAE